MPMMAIAAITPMVAGIKYRSAADCAAVGCGACVGFTSETVNAVLDCDGQYPCEPAKVAMTVKVPGMSGCQLRLKNPFSSVVVSPMGR